MPAQALGPVTPSINGSIFELSEEKVLTTDDFANIFIPALKKLIDTLLRQATGVRG